MGLVRLLTVVPQFSIYCGRICGQLAHKEEMKVKGKVKGKKKLMGDGLPCMLPSDKFWEKVVVHDNAEAGSQGQGHLESGAGEFS